MFISNNTFSATSVFLSFLEPAFVLLVPFTDLWNPIVKYVVMTAFVISLALLISLAAK
jgi:multisubunit Na+/H+ antiporter MnhC subunit